jgi:hypothetical protein
MAGHAYKAAVDELDTGVGRELVSLAECISGHQELIRQDAPFRTTVLEPVGKLNSYYGSINAAIDKRSHKVSLRHCFTF